MHGCLQNFPQNEEHEHIEFRYMCGEVEHSGALEEAGVPEADAIIIGPSENLPDGVVRVAHSLAACVLLSSQTSLGASLLPTLKISLCRACS